MASQFEEELLDAIESTGVTRTEAQHAAQRCAAAMALHGAVASGGAALLMIFVSKNPMAALSAGVFGFGAGAAHGLVTSPSCQEVRSAIPRWNFGKL